MASTNLIQQLANPVNAVAQGYQQREQKLQADADREYQRANEEQKRKDDDFHKVVQYAGDGFVEEARYFAQQKGMQVPETIFTNATFSKGLALAGSLYPDDPARAQEFTKAFMNTDGDYASRMNMAINTVGKPMSVSDRDFQDFVRKEQWKIKNGVGGGSSTGGFNLSPGQSRFDAQGNVIASVPATQTENQWNAKDRLEFGLKAYNAALGGIGQDPVAAREAAFQEYDNAFGRGPATGGQPSTGLTGGIPVMSTSDMNAPVARMQNIPVPPRAGVEPPSYRVQPRGPVNEAALKAMIENARAEGYSDLEIESELKRRGVMQ